MAGAAAPIGAGQDFYVPYFEVKLNGRPQGQDVIKDILQVSYKDDIKALDSFEITINNWDAFNRRFKYSDDQLFDPGKQVDLWMGYYGRQSLRRMIRGQITALRPNFPSGGGSTLAVSGLNALHRLQTEPRSATYENKTDSQIARQLATDAGLDFRSSSESSEQRIPYLFQDNQFDIIFLMERARRIGYTIYIEEKDSAKPTLVFELSTDERRPAYELEYGRSLIDFKPDLTTANQVNEVVVRGWDALNKQKIEEKATRQQILIKGVGKAGGQDGIDQAFKQRREIIATRPVATKAEAQTLALRTLEENAKDMIRASGSTVGLPDLRAGSVLKISGVGVRFNGTYFVTATTHAISDSGYTTQFECRREET